MAGQNAFWFTSERALSEEGAVIKAIGEMIVGRLISGASY